LAGDQKGGGVLRGGKGSPALEKPMVSPGVLMCEGPQSRPEREEKTEDDKRQLLGEYNPWGLT